MKNNSLDKKLDRAEESVKICKLNIDRQSKKLSEYNKKLTIIQNKITCVNSVSSNELEKLMEIETKLIIHINLHKGVILELQEDLNINKNNLQQLKSNSESVLS